MRNAGGVADFNDRVDVRADRAFGLFALGFTPDRGTVMQIRFPAFAQNVALVNVHFFGR